MGKPKRAGLAVSLLAILGTLLIAGCGSSKSSHTGEGKTSASNGSGSSAVMAKAEEEFKKYQTPVGLEGLTKIEKPIPTGKSIDFVNCAPAACVPPTHYMEQAAKVLGWTVKVIDAGETPTSQQAAMQQVVTEKPSAVVIVGLETKLFTKQLEALKQLKIATILWETAGAKEEPPLLYTLPGPTHYYKEVTKALAAAAVVAGGPEAQIGLMAVPAFPIYSLTINPDFKTAVASLCPACKVEEYQLPVSSLGKNATELITNFVRAHSNINVLVNDQDATSLGLEGALRGAGVTNVKDIGLYPTEANYPNLTNGTEFAFIPDPYHEIAWLAVDSLARIYTGGEPAPDIETTAPVVLWTKSSPPSYSPGKEPAVITSYEQKFKELWGK